MSEEQEELDPILEDSEETYESDIPQLSVLFNIDHSNNRDRFLEINYQSFKYKEDLDSGFRQIEHFTSKPPRYSYKNSKGEYEITEYNENGVIIFQEKNGQVVVDSKKISIYLGGNDINKTNEEIADALGIPIENLNIFRDQ